MLPSASTYSTVAAFSRGRRFLRFAISPPPRGSAPRPLALGRCAACPPGAAPSPPASASSPGAASARPGPPAIFSASRSSASSRLRAWPRASWATAVTTGPSLSTSLARCSSSSAAEASTSKTASTREAVTLACWPPGPEERLARSSTSAERDREPVVDSQSFGYRRVDFRGQLEVGRGQAALGVGRDGDRDLVPGDLEVGVVAHRLGRLDDARRRSWSSRRSRRTRRSCGSPCPSRAHSGRRARGAPRSRRRSAGPSANYAAMPAKRTQ